MSHLLHQKHEAFCQAYVLGVHAGNYTAAYEAAGYVRIDTNASRLAAQPHIKKRIAELRAEHDAVDRAATARAVARLALDKEMVLRELMKVGFANAFDYLSLDDDDQPQLDLARLEHDKGAAVRSLTVELEDAPDGTRRVKRMRFDLFEKRRALIDLGRHLGMFSNEAPDLSAQAKAGAAAIEEDMVRFTGAELDERLIGMFGRLAYYGVDLKELLERAVATSRLLHDPDDKPLNQIRTARNYQLETIAILAAQRSERAVKDAAKAAVAALARGDVLDARAVLEQGVLAVHRVAPPISAEANGVDAEETGRADTS